MIDPAELTRRTGRPIVLERPAVDGAGHRIGCELPHFTRDGRPKVAAAFLYVEHGGQGRRAVRCRHHAPTWVRTAMPGERWT